VVAVDVASVVADALRLVQRSAKVSGVSFETEVDGAVEVQARPNEIQQVFVNLLKNAAEAALDEHGPSNGAAVVVRAGKAIDHVWVDVCDNGVGIPDDRKAVVFDPFYTTKPPGKGTGLGLNVVYRIITKYRGTVQVESGVSQGTTFQIRIPTSG
jgi:signal transduction histidine kinase